MLRIEIQRSGCWENVAAVRRTSWRRIRDVYK